MMLLDEGLDNVFARHHRMAGGVRRAVDAWGSSSAPSARNYSDTVSAIFVPEGFDSDGASPMHAYHAYGVAFGVGLGEVAGKGVPDRASGR
jgi:alanine-glyoxylate transaminase/serine-glyoxylate transaminase/serine-pyruvate transaminase